MPMTLLGCGGSADLPTLLKTSRLQSGPSTGLRLRSPPPSMLSLWRHSHSVWKSSAEPAWARACSCSADSEPCSSKPHSWSCASASCQPDTMEAFTHCCWLWHSEAMLSALGCGTQDTGRVSVCPAQRHGAPWARHQAARGSETGYWSPAARCSCGLFGVQT